MIKTAAQILAEIEPARPLHLAQPFVRKAYTGVPEPCKEPGCPDTTGPNSGRGWCRRHYDRWRRTGDPNGHAPNISQCRSRYCNHGKEG